jgi:CHAT domain-containing protein
MGTGFRTVPATQALRDRLAASLAAADGAHLLLHGRFDDTEPLLSLLTDTAHSGPPIAAADLVGLPLRRLRLAVLSACESGRVATRLSNEIYGFPWALLATGVETAIVSRWVVGGESNGQWMRFFYGAVAEGAAPAAAAAVAMRGMRAAGRAHPYYWAAMQVNGR